MRQFTSTSTILRQKGGMNWLDAGSQYSLEQRMGDEGITVEELDILNLPDDYLLYLIEVKGFIRNKKQKTTPLVKS